VTLHTPPSNMFSPNRWYFGTLSFGGTRFYTKSTDPVPSLLRLSNRGALTFAPATEFPGCPGGFG